MGEKCYRGNDGKWHFCGFHYMQAEILSINGDIHVFCGHCHADLAGCVRNKKEQRSDRNMPVLPE